MSKLVRAISENGGVTICALDSTDIVRGMEQIHHPSATVSVSYTHLDVYKRQAPACPRDGKGREGGCLLQRTFVTAPLCSARGGDR